MNDYTRNNGKTLRRPGYTVERTCQHCGEVFYVTKTQNRIDPCRYCCWECRIADTHIKISCKYCGEEFEIKRGQISEGRKYCCKECSCLDRRVRTQCTCLQCGVVFQVTPSDLELGRGKYCSATCFSLANRGSNHHNWQGGIPQSYGANWNTQRRRAYKRDGGICQICHRKHKKGQRGFEVHHIVKRRHFDMDDPAANALSNLITLCPKCHIKAEKGQVFVPVRLI